MELEGCLLPLTVLFQTSRDPKSPQKISLMTLQKAHTDPLDALELVCHIRVFFVKQKEKKKSKRSESHCLKITQNVPFEFLAFWHFPPIFCPIKTDLSGNTV